MSFSFPVVLQLTGKSCLVIAGSWGAENKVNELLRAGAAVTVLSPLSLALPEWLVDQGLITWLRREYRSGDLDGFFLVIAATGDHQLNERIWEEAEAGRILFNAVDDPRHCNFIFPAVHRQGDLLLAVSSNGKSPALATRLRDRFAQELGPEYGQFLRLLGALREEMTARHPDFETRKRLWYELVDSEACDLLRRGKVAAAERVLRQIVEQSVLHSHQEEHINA